jgi:hypothetical protein
MSRRFLPQVMQTRLDLQRSARHVEVFRCTSLEKVYSWRRQSIGILNFYQIPYVAVVVGRTVNMANLCSSFNVNLNWKFLKYIQLLLRRDKQSHGFIRHWYLNASFKITLWNVVRVKYLYDINSRGTSDQSEFCVRSVRINRLFTKPLPDNGLRAG